jgi:hypothetical protein
MAAESAGMFLRSKIRRKDGKVHRTWSLVENRRVRGNRIVQRQVLYLGEINDTQQAAWSRTIEAFADGRTQAHQMTLFPEGRSIAVPDSEVVEVRLGSLEIRRPLAMGRMLTGLSALGTTVAGGVLVGPASAQPQGHTRAKRVQDAGGLPIAGPRQRMAAAPPVV